METSLKSGFAQIFSCYPKNLSCPKFGLKEVEEFEQRLSRELKFEMRKGIH